MATLSLIAAVAKNGVIGNSNDIPWYLPADLAYFKERTVGHTVLMGRNTYESILARIHKPLPQRQNIVLSDKPEFEAPGCIVASSLPDALRHLKEDEEAFIIGGAMLYKTALPMVTRLYLTEVQAEIPGDTLFPEWNRDDWVLEKEVPRPKDAKNPYDVVFRTYVRK